MDTKKNKPKAPTDNIGMPLPILPLGESKKDNYYDEHHHFFEDSRLGLDSRAGRAIRYSRVQYIPRFLHNRFHFHYDQPDLPTLESARFLLVVMSHAGYVPEDSIDLRDSNEPKLTYIPPALRRRFYSDTIYADTAPIGSDGQHYKRRTTGRYIADYVLGQQLSQKLNHVDERLIAEFLDNRTAHDRLRQLGSLLISEAIDVAVEPIVPIHMHAAKSLLLPEGAPKHPFQSVRGVFTDGHDKDYLDVVKNGLLQAAS